MKRIIFHIDVNSAYLSWSAIEKLKEHGSEEVVPDLRTIPSIIGGNQKNRHGIVLAKSIPAKKYKIQTGEPIVNALKKCPDLIIEPPNHALYEHYSEQLTNYLASFCPDLEKVSIDECYMDFTSIAHLYPSPETAAKKIRNTIQNRFGYTVNIGISENKVLAKMASDFEKPNKIHTLFRNEIEAKMWPLPIYELYMAGKSSVNTLHKLEIYTIGDLAHSNPDILCTHLKSHGRLLWEYANGIDDTPVISAPSVLKGIGNSITLSSDAHSAEEAKHALLSLSESVSGRLRSSKQLAGNICVEIKYNTFQSVSHQMQFDRPTNVNNEIYHFACILFDELWNRLPIRLLGIRTSKLVSEDEPVQLSIFDFSNQNTDSTSQKQRNLDKAIDKIRNKYGNQAIMRGSFLENPNEFKKH